MMYLTDNDARRLVFAIILQTVKDWRRCVSCGNQELLNDLREEIRSEWFGDLLSLFQLSQEVFLSRLEREVKTGGVPIQRIGARAYNLRFSSRNCSGHAKW